MPPRTSLKTFLHSAKSLLTAPQTSHTIPLTFVLGNESADLDSLCSSILYAYLKTYTSNTTLSKTSSPFYIPLSNLPRSDLRLRPELAVVLRHANLLPSDLITLSDLPFAIDGTATLNEGTRWVLVDHNSFAGKLGKQFGEHVVGVVDHHVDEGRHVEGCEVTRGGEGRVIEVVGSCTSLIIRESRSSWPALRDGARDNEEVAMLALGAILIDTNGLTSKDKTKPTDVSAVEFLESLLLPRETTGDSYKREIYGREISRAKDDVGGLSLEELLRKDYKQWPSNGIELGISSVIKPVNYLIGKAGSEGEFFNIIKRFAKERGLGLVSIMTTSTDDGTFKRELFLEAVDDGAVGAAEKFFVENAEKLGLKTWEEGRLDVGGEGREGSGWRRCWTQGETKNSRKQVAPILRQAL